MAKAAIVTTKAAIAMAKAAIVVTPAAIATTKAAIAQSVAGFMTQINMLAKICLAPFFAWHLIGKWERNEGGHGDPPLQYFIFLPDT